MTIASSNSLKIGVAVAKEKYESHINSSDTYNTYKASPVSRIQKTTSVPTPTKSTPLQFPTLTRQPWLKNNLCKVSCLVSVSKQRVSNPTLSVV